MRKTDRLGKYFRLIIPIDNIEYIQDFFKNAEHFFTALHNVVLSKFSFELYLSQNKLNFYIWLEDSSEFNHFFNLLTILYPSFNYQFIYSEAPYFSPEKHYLCKKLKIGGSEFEPFLVMERKDSVFEHIVRLLLKSDRDSEVCIQILLQSTYFKFPFLSNRAKKYEPVKDFVTKEQNKLIDQYEYKIKCADVAYRVQITVTVEAEKYHMLESAILESLKTAFEKGGNRFLVKNADFNNVINHKFERSIIKRQIMIPRELGQFTIFPTSMLEKAGLAYSYFSISKQYVASKNKFDIIVGKSLFKNFEYSKIHMSLNEGEHTAVFGETGYGKSTFLINTFLQSLDKDATLIFLDPVGNSVKDIISKIDPVYLSNIVYIAPTESPIGINLMDVYSNSEKDIAVSRLTDDIILTLKSVTEAKSGIENGLIGTKIEDILKHTIIGLTDIPRSTFIDISYILNREHSRLIFKKLTKNIHALDFIEDYSNYTPLDLNSTRRIVNYVKTDNVLRRMVCTRTPKFSLEDSINKKKIILINGERGKVGASASSFLLSAYLTKIWIYTQFRKEKDKIILFADEFHEYSNLSFSDILVTGRKENLSIFLSTTNTNLISNTLLSSILSNVKNLALFKLSAEDSEKFGMISKDLDLTKLTKLVAYIKTDEQYDLVNIDLLGGGNNLNFKKIIDYNSVFVTEDDSLPSIFLNLEAEYFELFQSFLDLEVLNKNTDFHSLYWVSNTRAQKIKGEYIDQKDFYDLVEDCLKNKLINKDNRLFYTFTESGLKKFMSMIHGDRDVNLKIYRYFTQQGFICSLPFSENQSLICNPNDLKSEGISKQPLVIVHDNINDIEKYRDYTPVYAINNFSENLGLNNKNEDAYIFELNTSLFEKLKDFKIKNDVLSICSDLFLIANKLYDIKDTSVTRISKYLSTFFPELTVKSMKDVLESYGIIAEQNSIKLNKAKIKVMQINLDLCKKYGRLMIDEIQYKELERKLGFPILLVPEAQSIDNIS
ncbi:MAG: hypothetical protein QW258_00790 [Thermoplasmata archaeon]